MNKGMWLKFFNVPIKRVNEVLMNIRNNVVHGCDQITMTVERSEVECGKYNIVVYLSPEKRLLAKQIAYRYQKLEKELRK